jgi:phosphocarrier protein HPr
MASDSIDPPISSKVAGGGAKSNRREVKIVNKRGLHARAAARFAKLAEEFDVEILVTGNGMTVSALSIMGLMMLGAGPGTSIQIASARNNQARAKKAVAALTALVEAGFDED